MKVEIEISEDKLQEKVAEATEGIERDVQN